MRIHLPAALVVLVLLLALADAARARARDPGDLLRAFACIHRHEGAWDAHTGNGYYGGLQMDYSFMRAYGPEYLRAFGTADRWPPALQLAVAVRAYLAGRGFGPWPNTARICGLL